MRNDNSLTLSVRRLRKSNVRTSVNTGVRASEPAVVPVSGDARTSIKDTGGVSIRQSLSASGL